MLENSKMVEFEISDFSEEGKYSINQFKIAIKKSLCISNHSYSPHTKCPF